VSLIALLNDSCSNIRQLCVIIDEWSLTIHFSATDFGSTGTGSRCWDGGNSAAVNGKEPSTYRPTEDNPFGC
jgi:hypothetical protein